MRISVLLVLLSSCILAYTSKYFLDLRNQRQFIARRPTVELSKAGFSRDAVQKYNLGFENVVADLLWIYLLQEASHDPIAPGKVSWEFIQLDSITALDTKFVAAYQFGASFLSVFRRDKLGAKILLEKWVRRQNASWRPNFFLGYHLYYELGELAEASKYILKASQMNGAPYWLSALGVRLFTEAGGLIPALKLTIELYQGMHSEEGRKRLQLRMLSLTYAIQKRAWEDAVAKYRAMNGTIPSDLKAIQPLVEKQNREIASLFEDNEIPLSLAPILGRKFTFRYDPKQKKVLSNEPDLDADIERLGIYPSREPKGSGGT